MQRIDKMFAAVAEKDGQNAELEINEGRPFEWFLTRTGDYALEFTLVYFLKQLPVTNVIKKVRRHLMVTNNTVNKLVYQQSILRGVDLATPLVVSHANSPPIMLLDGQKADKTLATDES